MKTNCINCGIENPKNGMKTCCRKCADEFKSKQSREIRNCLYCENQFEVRKKETKQMCSDDCRKQYALLPEVKIVRQKIFKNSVKLKYGVENVFELQEIQDKTKRIKFEKYGDENYNNSEKQLKTIKEKYGENYYYNMVEDRKKTTMEQYGVEHHLQLLEFLEKRKQTNLKRYGVESISQLDETKNKVIETTQKRYGVNNASQSQIIKDKKKKTSMDNFGVEHHLKDYDMFQKHQIAQFKTKKYKETNITYQGSYEKYFLELLEEKSLLNEVENGKSYIYTFESKQHIYHTDFYFRGQNIEIKSGWTYDNNGKNLQLREINEIKWQSVKNAGDILVTLINKSEINGFIKTLS